MRWIGVGTASVGLLLGGPALAQERWGAPAVAVQSGSEVCAAAVDGDRPACLGVGCLSAAPLAVHLYLPDVFTPEVFGVGFRIDDGPRASLIFDAVRDPENHRAIVTPDTMSLLESLADGERVALTVVLDDRIVAAEFTLAGSRAAIEAALASCPVQDASVRPAGAEEVMAGAVAMGDGEDGFSDEEAALSPVARAYSAIAEQCAMQGEEATVAPDFARRADLDGDGAEDLIIDWGGVACPSAGYCSPDGCQHEVWLARASGEGYDPLLVENAIEVVPGEPGRIVLQRAGDACGLAASERCETTFAIEDRALVATD